MCPLATATAPFMSQAFCLLWCRSLDVCSGCTAGRCSCRRAATHGSWHSSWIALWFPPSANTNAGRLLWEAGRLRCSSWSGQRRQAPLPRCSQMGRRAQQPRLMRLRPQKDRSRWTAPWKRLRPLGVSSPTYCSSYGRAISTPPLWLAARSAEGASGCWTAKARSRRGGRGGTRRCRQGAPSSSCRTTLAERPTRRTPRSSSRATMQPWS
mmetsp:Transcript_24588/g.70709  ORF Transcript_24588/g.70709 Transcript_24588/m.70709 type:complete len:210 (+) Transcript_24588:1211-1840(+)